MVVVIDRIEENTAVVELPDNSTIKVPAVLFEDAKEGAAYIVELTKNPVSERVKKLMNEVFDD